VLIVLCWLESGSNGTPRNVSHPLTYILRGLANAARAQPFGFGLPGGFVVNVFDCGPRGVETLRCGGLSPPLHR
jgi:hypothetical protein